jgi:predicted aspartyl protease
VPTNFQRIIKIPLHIIDLQGGFHPVLAIPVYGRQFTAVLDTGASKTAFDKTLL